MNSNKSAVGTEQQVEPKKDQKSLTIRTGIRGGLAVRLMID